MTDNNKPAPSFPQPPNAPGWKQKPPAGGMFAIAVLVAGIAAALSPSEGAYKPVYLDSAGIKTACKGIIGPQINAKPIGFRFTNEQCDAMEQAYLVPMVRRMQSCIPANITAELAYGEWITYGHWSYNTSVESFCHSTLAKKLAAGDHRGACEQMAVWTWTPVARGTTPAGKTNGKPQPYLRQDCRDPRNKCSGIAKRRELEVAMCLAALS